MLIQNLFDLKPTTERAIIINVNTKLVTTLALLSAIRYAKMPVLLIDCQSTDGSMKHFQSLMERYEFDILTAAPQTHGLTLNWVFRNCNSEKILLIDSDLEIKEDSIIAFFKQYIDEPRVFGCGFTDGPGVLTDSAFQKMNLQNALFHERPWMPLTLLKTAPVREALDCGKSFENFTLDNQFTISPFLTNLRSKYRLIRRILRRGPAVFRRQFHMLKPPVVFYDTGARIFDYLRYEKFMFYVGLPESVHERYVTHFMGITRNILDSEDTHGAGGLNKIEVYVQDRLLKVYGERVL